MVYRSRLIMIANNASQQAIDDAVPARRRVLGVRVDDVTWPEVLASVDAFVASGAPHQVVTPNPEMVMLARRDKDFWAILERADLAPCDGVGLCWAGRVLGQPLREVVAGSELVPRMAVEAGTKGQRWFLLGGEEGVAEKAGAALLQRSAGLEIAGTHAGSPGPEHDDAICSIIEGAAPIDVLLVAYGAPAQEKWIARNQRRLEIPVAMGVGGTFNFLSGRSPLPPPWVARANLIWLHRLATEPWRWRRQARLVPFVALVLGEALRRRIRLGGSPGNG